MRYGLFSIPLLVVGLILDIFFLVDGTYVFGSQFNSYQTSLTIYISMDALMLAVIGKTPELQISFLHAIVYFVPSFVLSTFLISALISPSLLSGVSLTFQDYIMQVFFQVFVVALSEELIFRGLLIKYFGWIGQGIVFGLFHLEAYSLQGFTSISVLVAMAFGILMGAIVKLFSSVNETSAGISVTWGIHAGYNLAISLGIFSLGLII